jgi:DNA-binding transcriptional ArsR family regulator
MGYHSDMDPFMAVADPVRRSLLRELADAPCRVVDLAASRAISRPAVSKHLRLLLESGLATAEDRGRERWYSLRPDGLVAIEEFTGSLRGPRPRFEARAFDGLELEVRRTSRDRRATHDTTTEETA